MSMLVAYWHKDGLDIYRFVDKKPVRQASGSLEELKPVRGIFDKKVLIVGRELLFHTRKKYPPASIKNLTRAVALEIGGLFPISKPAFHCRVYESSNTYTTLDIWAWESEQYAQVKKIFPFNYIVAEDLAYSSEVPEVKVFQYRGMTNILAHSGDRFLGGASYPDAGIDEKDVERFLSGLDKYRSDIKRIKIYGSIPFNYKETGIPVVSKVPETEYPPCVDYFNSLKLKEFKTKGDYNLSSKIDLILRVLIYLIFGYGVMLYLTARNYDQGAWEIRQKINSIDAKISKRDTGPKVVDYSEVIREVNERMSKKHSPLKVMDMIASRLPAGSFVNRMVLNENNLEISLSSRDPLSVVKTLGGAEGVKAARLKGTPIKDSATGSYNFIIMMELSR